MSDDGYVGFVELIDGVIRIVVDVIFGGYFDLISGLYNWYGCVVVSLEVVVFVVSGVCTVVLRMLFVVVDIRLFDVDLWGWFCVEGFGAMFFDVVDIVVC